MRSNTEALYNSIRALIEGVPLRCSFGEKIRQKNFEGKGEIQKFLAFLNA